MTAWFRVAIEPLTLFTALPLPLTVENRGPRTVGMLVGEENHTILPAGETVVLPASPDPLRVAADTGWTTLRVTDGVDA
jgi:hypothetical protein